MKKVLIVMPLYSLPLDAKMGGAIEQLMNGLIKENEKYGIIDLHFTTFDEVEEKYSKTTIHVVKENKIKKFFIKAVNKIFKILKIKYRICSNYYKKVLDIAKSINPDKIIFEGFYDTNISKFGKYFNLENLYLHVHNVETNKKDISLYFGNLISVSNYVSNDWIKTIVFKNELKKHVLPNCITSDNFFKSVSKKERLELRKQLDINNSDYICLYCGRLHEEKGIDKLIQAIVELNLDNLKLIVVGESFFKNSKPTKFSKCLIEMSQKIKDKIIFTGFIPNNELYKYYAISDLHIIPTVCEEAAGIVALEGKAMNINQIISNSGGLQEYAGKYYKILRGENFVEELKVAIKKAKNNELTFSENKSIIYDLKFYYEKFLEIINK